MSPNTPRPAGTTSRIIRHYELPTPLEVEISEREPTGPQPTQRMKMKLTKIDLHLVRYGAYPWKLISVQATGDNGHRDTWTEAASVPACLREWLAGELNKVLPALNAGAETA